MSHPHKSMLDEFQYAINHFVPTLPAEIKLEAQTLHDKLVADESTDELALKKAFYEIGRKEYPHRHAYEDLTHTTARELMKQMVIDHVDETVRGVIKPHLDSGVTLEELISSEIFETKLDAKQRYQVEDGVLVANSKLAEKLKSHVGAQSSEYEKLVQKWTKHTQEIDDAIRVLEEYAQGGNENQQSEIKSKVEKFREGFLVTEPDPNLDEVKKEIEYWKETFSEE
jgi:hypothetical protein